MNDEARELDRLVGEQTERQGQQSDVEYLRELGSRASVGLDAARQQARTYERSLAQVVRALALTPGRNSVVQLVRLLDEHGPFGCSGADDRFVASLLAEAQQPADLAELFYDRSERDRRGEVRACLFHELLLRGVDVSAPRGLSSWPVVRPSWHALSWLPSDLRPFETGSPFPSRSIRGGGGRSWSGLPSEGRLDPPTPRTGERAALTDIATRELHERIVSAPESGDVGHCAAWAFALDAPLDPALVPALVPSLPMGCVAGLGPTARFEIALRSLDDIWKILFSAASMDGSYGGGVYGAWGRRWTWQSLGGLSGAPSDASAQEVERWAKESTWFHFECDSEWFQNEIYDYGIAALSPDRRRIAVLAVTDTD
ncbi:DUF6183 family protein [Streptomyces sp. NPDC059752]|uniref:DUF6183 family protein n=1 Tax=unclassified Streptomyces TaxID=2593676 RepID=UPI003649BBEA